MNNEVTGCVDCPFLYRSEECQRDPFDCQHPVGSKIRIKYNKIIDPITPDECPLRKEPITVSFKSTYYG